MRLYRSFMVAVSKFTYVLIVILMAIMIILVFGQIITRYIVGSTPSFINELVTYMLIWLSFIGSSLAIRMNKHVAIDIIYRRIKSSVMITIIKLLSLTFLILLFFATVIFALEQWEQYSATMGIRMTWIILVTSFGTLLMIFQQIEFFLPVDDIENEKREAV